MNEIDTKTYKTKDYELFKFLSYNRKVNESHVQKLMKSISKRNMLSGYPIKVTKNLEIIDGQHRLKAAKNLGVDIYYTVDENFHEMDVMTINVNQKSWAVDDYVDFWRQKGMVEYIKLYEMMQKYGYKAYIFLMWFTDDSMGLYNKFKNGDLELNKDPKITTAFLLMRALCDLMRNNPKIHRNIYNQRAFHKACKRFFMNQHINGEKFLRQYEKYPYSIQYRNDFNNYLEQLVNIYNYNSSSRVKIVFDKNKTDIIV